MNNLALPISPQEWMRQMFATRTAMDGGIVRRKVSDVERLVGRDAFLEQMRRRGYRVAENSGHFVVFCNSDPVQLHL
ncbi:MAG: N-(5'-phosphoribosyl)anthranilate isomerase [Paracoccaceae bacterium]